MHIYRYIIYTSTWEMKNKVVSGRSRSIIHILPPHLYALLIKHQHPNHIPRSSWPVWSLAWTAVWHWGLWEARHLLSAPEPEVSMATNYTAMLYHQKAITVYEIYWARFKEIITIIIMAYLKQGNFFNRYFLKHVSERIKDDLFFIYFWLIKATQTGTSLLKS